MSITHKEMVQGNYSNVFVSDHQMLVGMYSPNIHQFTESPVKIVITCKKGTVIKYANPCSWLCGQNKSVEISSTDLGTFS